MNADVERRVEGEVKGKKADEEERCKLRAQQLFFAPSWRHNKK